MVRRRGQDRASSRAFSALTPDAVRPSPPLRHLMQGRFATLRIAADTRNHWQEKAVVMGNF
jgi:hypothetical protein